jgi:ssDNA-binding Zn-finger/Zn-ribbon topoisomerase 1
MKSTKRIYTREQKDRHNFLKRLRHSKNPEGAKCIQKKIFHEKANAYKLERGCIDCGYKAHAVALHFDHVYGEKVKNVCEFYDWDLALEEVAKCVVRCANCHAIKTLEKKEFKGWRKK